MIESPGIQRGLMRAVLLALSVGGLCACTGPDAPDPDGWLRRGLFSEPTTLDPHLSRQNEMASLLHDLYEGLLTLDSDGALVPGVAEAWTTSDDGLRYEFSLRPTARWSDGSPVVAEDFVTSFRRVVTPATASPHPGMLSMILGAEDIAAGRAPPETLGVRALDRHRLEVELGHPAPYFLSVLAHSAAMPVHAASLAAHGREFTRAGRLVSNGAYLLSAREDYQYLELVKNPHYWNADEVAVERVRYVPFDGNETAQLTAYRAGQLDMTDVVPTSGMTQVTDELAEELVVRPTRDTFYYGFNLRAGPLAEAAKLREALSLSLDRETVVDRVTRFGETPAYGFVPPVFDGYEPARPDWSDWTEARRIAAARAATGAAPEVPLRVLYNTNEGLRRITVAVTSMWREHAGVESRLENQEFGVFLQTLGDPGAWDVARLSWRADFDDPYAFLEIFMSDSPNNFVGFADPEYDDLIRRSHRAPDRATRMSLLAQAEQRLLAAHAIAPVFFYVDRLLAKPWIELGERVVLEPLPTRQVSIAPR